MHLACSAYCFLNEGLMECCLDSQINDEDVSLGVNAEFQRGYLGEPLDVEFSFNRLELGLCSL